MDITQSSSYKCKFCHKTYTKNFLLRRHVFKVHPNQEVPAALPLVGRTRPMAPELKKVCEDCGKLFVHKSGLSRHIKQCHANAAEVKVVGQHACQHCQKVYRYASSLKVHCLKKHPGESLPPDGRSLRYITPTETRHQLMFDNITGL